MIILTMLKELTAKLTRPRVQPTPYANALLHSFKPLADMGYSDERAIQMMKSFAWAIQLCGCNPRDEKQLYIMMGAILGSRHVHTEYLHLMFRVCPVVPQLMYQWLNVSKARLHTMSSQGKLGCDVMISALIDKHDALYDCVMMLNDDPVSTELPEGVYFSKGTGKFRSECVNTVTGDLEYLGHHDNPDDAHKAWLKRMNELQVKSA